MEGRRKHEVVLCVDKEINNAVGFYLEKSMVEKDFPQHNFSVKSVCFEINVLYTSYKTCVQCPGSLSVLKSF